LVEVILIENEKNYIVATVQSWNVDAFYQHVRNWPGKWTLISNEQELSERKIKNIKPRYIFFPHWSWRVPDEILQISECVCFHMTNLPYGRGGSPLQNLIVRGHDSTYISALKMVSDLDSGPIYLKKPLKLIGNAQEIYKNSAEIICQMIENIVSEEPEAKPQKGKPLYFTRRTPQESLLPISLSIREIYDYIRMLDADNYPRAFIEYGDMKIEFFNASIESEESISAKVEIKLKKNSEIEKK
tara:strand:+ start:25802 stop:26530 length:729 start_codon:yes stop_codon:yes gene_type:complete